MPAPPIPLVALPIRNVERLRACEVITAPIEKNIEVTKIQYLGENIWASLPASGAKLAVEIYLVVSHVMANPM